MSGNKIERDLMQNMQNTKERWHDFDQDSD